MSNYFLGYPLFNDIRNSTLRAFNRANIFMNIKERYGSVPAQRYLKKFGKSDQFTIYNLMVRINDDGFEQTRRNLRRNKEI